MRTRADIRNFWLLASLAAAITAVGLGAAYYMAVHGHIVTGMNNEVVWGLPHVFAIFMIVAASGVLNVASVGTVFGQPVYKKRAPLAGLLSIALLTGGLMVLMLDLGRPDRVLIAATHFNFTSVFAWNVFLYSGMVAIVVVYLWTIFERGMDRYTKPVGLAVLVWRFVLTTGTGFIFAFLVARQAYQSALLAPLFIVLSLGWGQAVFLITQSAIFAWNGRVLDDAIRHRMARLLGIFIVAALYLVAVYYLTNLYYAKQVSFVRFILLDGGIYPLLFWGGYVLIGSVLPLLLLFHPKLSCARTTFAASALVVAGAFAFLYVFIVGGQAFPLEIFPGHVVSSSFGDGAIAAYVPRLPELLLGVGGLGAALLLTVVGLRAFNFMPQDDSVSAKS
jgi:molybdopterin-containing oxidoreductase family membrane subunit